MTADRSDVLVQPNASLPGPGDSFAVITSLFAGLAFTGLLASIGLQREDLKLTRRELQETKVGP